jgi:dihydroorotate dehydrogenase
VPVIGSLNGATAGGWVRHARAMQDAGASAVELNIYWIPGPGVSASEVESRHVDVLSAVKAAVSVPVAVKLSPFFIASGEVALGLDAAGADGLVLFNRFLQPDIDPDTLKLVPTLELSSPAEARLARTWISLLRQRVRGSLAATTGVEDAADVAKYLLAGADVVMTASALLRHGVGHVGHAACRTARVDDVERIRLGRLRAGRVERAGRHRPRRVRTRRLRQRPGGSHVQPQPLVTPPTTGVRAASAGCGPFASAAPGPVGRAWR